MKAKRFLRSTILGVILLMMANANGRELVGVCRIEFYGTSTLHDFDGEVTSRPFALSAEGAKTNLSDLEGATIEVQVSQMDTGKKKMNRNMYRMFEAEDHPAITGTVAEVLPSDENAERPSRVEFDVKIRDVEKRVSAEVKRVRYSGDDVEFDLEMTVSCEAFKLEPPTMFGVLRVDDKVRVEITIAIKERS